MATFKYIWQKNAPLCLQNRIKIYTDSPANKRKRKSYLDFLKQKSGLTDEEKQASQYFKNHPFTPFPFGWAGKYDRLTPEVYFDDFHSCFYVFFENKKLYFPKNYSKKQVVWTIRSIYREQDSHSAHRYLTDNFQPHDNSIMIDGGVAEGSLSLSLIEKVKKLYLIECEKNWIEALQLTFEPWKEKVEIVGKYLSDKTDEHNITIDSILEADENEKYFIKLDVEGYEKLTLKGMNRFFAKVRDLKMCVCTYHYENDAAELEKILKNRGMSCEFSESSLLFSMHSEIPSFRKALIRARKE